MIDGETPDESRLVDLRVHVSPVQNVIMARWSHYCPHHNVAWMDEHQDSPCPWCALENARRATRCFVLAYQLLGCPVPREALESWPWIKSWVLPIKRAAGGGAE